MISRRVGYYIPLSMIACLLGGYLLDPVLAPAQNAAQKRGTNAPHRAATKRPPLTKANVQSLWDAKNEDLLLNELRLRGLAFEPEEDWVTQLKDPADQPRAIAALRKLIPPAPTPEAVAAQAPDLLAKLKDAAQQRSEAAMGPLVHPDLMAEKARIYDLFDIANYRDHSLGRISPMENRRVGVQFFELTTSQVERLYYLVFETYGGKIVLRDVITGPDVASMFLHDEEKLAIAKLDLMFRALNDKDDSGLKNLCTPGLYDSLKRLTDGTGSTLVRGKYTSIAAISLTPSVSLDQKSARVVVRVGYPDLPNKPLQYDVDFERIGKDLKVVRVRDLQGGVIAWDPDIDNYLMDRYHLPRGEPITKVAESDDPRFYALSRFRTFVTRALESREAPKLKEYAAEFLAREPNGGEGYGIRAAAEQILGSYDDAAKDATLAIERGGTAYFVVLRHNSTMMSTTAAVTGNQFSKVILGISKAKIEYRPFTEEGGAPEEIPIASIQQSQIEKTEYHVSKPRPFLDLDFNNGSKKVYNFAAFGTICPGETPATARPAAGLEQFIGGSVCPAPASAQQQQQPRKKGHFSLPGGMELPEMPKMPGSKNNQTVPMLVPLTWQQDLKVVADAIDQARHGGALQAQQ